MKAFDKKLNELTTINVVKKISRDERMRSRIEKINVYLERGFSQRRISYLLKIPQPTICYTIKKFREDEQQ